MGDCTISPPFSLYSYTRGKTTWGRRKSSHQYRVSHTSHGKIQKWLEPLEPLALVVQNSRRGVSECRGAFFRHPISKPKKEVYNYHVYPSKFVLCTHRVAALSPFVFYPKSYFFFCLVSPLQESQILAAMTATRQLVKNTSIVSGGVVSSWQISWAN